MNPAKVDRSKLRQLTDLPNIGPACAEDLRLIGIATPDQLRGRDPFEMYLQLCDITGARHDPCVIDVFMSVTAFMAGEPPQPWWKFTETRKRVLSHKSDTSNR